MPSSPRLRLYRIIRPSLVLSQSFTDRLWCGQNEKWWIMGRSRDQFAPEGPEVSTWAACCSPAVQDQAKGRRAAGNPNLQLEAPHGTDSSQTPRWRETDSNLYGAFPVKWSFGLLVVLCSEVCPGKASMFSRRQSCRGKSQSPVVRIAEEMETEPSKPIDKISRGEITSHRAVSKENALWPRKR
jgi:hypothetical protein